MGCYENGNKSSGSVKCGVFVTSVGRDNSVGIATCYGLDDPRIESRQRRDFLYPSRPTLGPTQSPIQWVPGLSGGGKAAGSDVDHPPHLAPSLKKE